MSSFPARTLPRAGHKWENGGPIFSTKPLVGVTNLLSHRCLKGPRGLMLRRPPANSQGTSFGLQCQRTCWVRGRGGKREGGPLRPAKQSAHCPVTACLHSASPVNSVGGQGWYLLSLTLTPGSGPDTQQGFKNWGRQLQ